VGNLTDRIFRAPGPFQGHVVDFVSLFDDGGQIWPVFNLADASLFIGLGSVVLLEWTRRRYDGTRAPKDPQPDEADAGS
jgi:signal peptidase II